MPPARLVSGFSVPSKTPPKITGLMSFQSKPLLTSAIVAATSAESCGTTIERSWKRPPLMYGNAAARSSR